MIELQIASIKSFQWFERHKTFERATRFFRDSKLKKYKLLRQDPLADADRKFKDYRCVRAQFFSDFCVLSACYALGKQNATDELNPLVFSYILKLDVSVNLFKINIGNFEYNFFSSFSSKT